MTSIKQRKANIKNSKSGGVKSLEGKNVSKYNAQKHAILRQTITEYEKEIYTNVLQQLIQEFKPEGVIEEILVERIAVYYVKLYRVAKAENEFFKEKFNIEKVKTIFHEENEHMKLIPLPVYEENTVIKPAYTAKVTSDDIEKITKTYTRYETTLENRLYKALHHLERLQRMRKGESISAPFTFDVGIDEMGSFGKSGKNE